MRALTLMIPPQSRRIGIVTSGAEKLANYFPTAAEPPAVVRELSDRVAVAVPRAFANRGGLVCRMPLYLRIDVIETAAGSLLTECEGVEPELFFRARPGSAARFAELIEGGKI